MFTVACLKTGTFYGPEYVNKLYNMVKRNLTIPFRFTCITEDPKGISSAVEIIPLPYNGLSGWWNKVQIFREDVFKEGTVLFLDLDLVILKNIDRLFTYETGSFCIIKDFLRLFGDNTKFNSSVFRFEAEQHHDIWHEYIKRKHSIETRCHGDQDWLELYKGTEFVTWPLEWCMSYKWEVIKLNTLPEDCMIAVFHGKPKPSDVATQLVMNNWK